MAKLQDLKKYLNYEFSLGCHTGDDYKTFERKYINYLKSLCKEKGWEMVWASKNHYCFTACFSFNGKYIYVSISDVRFFKNEWYNHVLFRTMEHHKDYRGGMNCYTTLPQLGDAITSLFHRMVV